MRRRYLNQRPDTFLLKYDHPLANGLVFAGLCDRFGSNKFNDSSIYNHLSYSNTTFSWNYSHELQRGKYSFPSGRTISYSNGIVIPSNDILDLSNSCTLSVWIRPTGNWYGGANDLAMAAIGRTAYVPNPGAQTAYGLGIYHGNSNQCRLRAAFCDYAGGHYHTEFVSSVIFQTLNNAWLHIAIVKDASGGLFYRNGISEGSANFPYPISYYSKGNAMIAGLPAINWRQLEWDGDITDTLIYNRALSSIEIQQLADPSNVMLSGMLEPPKRQLYTISYHPATEAALLTKVCFTKRLTSSAAGIKVVRRTR